MSDDNPTESDKREAKLADLRAALIEGEQSGFAAPFDIEEFILQMRKYRTEKY